MTEYRIKWCQCPHIHHSTSVLFVEAASADDARAIATDHIERKYGVSWFTIFEATPTTPLPAGQVRE